VQVGSLSVEEVGVRFPDLIEHLDARTQFRYVVPWIERQTVVFPHLTEVAVHREHLPHSPHVTMQFFYTQGLVNIIQNDTRSNMLDAHHLDVA